MPERSSHKAQLRADMRQQRQALSPQAQFAAAKALSTHLSKLPGWSEAGRVALYLANDGEIETTFLESFCRSTGKDLYLPVINDMNQLEFASWDINRSLAVNRYGIPEPDSEAARCSPSVLDILILPLVAWDLQGARVGMGGGFYDRVLAGVSGPLLVGVAHAFQQVACVPTDPWDISMDFVMTDAALHRCRETHN